MKHFVSLLLSVLVCTTAMAQHKHAIKVSPFTFLKGQPLMVHYEYNAFNNATISLGLAPVVSGPILGSLVFPPTEFNSGFAIDPEIRWYAKDAGAMNGFFFGLYNSNRLTNWTTVTGEIDIASLLTGEFVEENDAFGNPLNASYDVKASKHIFGFQLGTHKPLGDHFSVDFYSGLGLSVANTEATGSNTGTVSNIPSGGINLRLNLAFGWQI